MSRKLGFFLCWISSIAFGHSDYQTMIDQGLIIPGQPVCLNLGCGEIHFQGHINIDLPLSAHTVQERSGADYYCDITKMKFPKESVQKIRHQHVFEYFNRQQALALLCAWHMWLEVDGKLRIEIPDFEAAARRFIGDKDFLHRQVILRHVFGSHEADWANNRDGWYREKFERVLKELGFEEIKFNSFSWNVIDNLIVKATKKRSYPIEDLKKRAHKLLQESLVDQARSEERMWSVWCKGFDQCLADLVE